MPKPVRRESGDDDPSDPQLDLVGYYPLPRLIGASPWLLSALVLFLVSGFSALIYWGSQAASGRLAAPSELVDFLDLQSGPAARWVGAVSLLASAQLCTLIGWARSCSPRDFGGNYRVWRWAAAACLMAAFAYATDAHQVFSAVVFWHWKVRFWEQHTIAWLLPAYVTGLGLFWPLHRDMRRCWTSLVLLFVAGAAALAAVAEKLQLIVWPNPLVSTAVVLITLCSLLCSLLIHSRFVIYISCDPPEPRRTEKVRRAGLWRRFFRRRNKATPVGDTEQSQATDTSEESEQAGQSSPAAASRATASDSNSRGRARPNRPRSGSNRKSTDRTNERAEPNEDTQAAEESDAGTQPKSSRGGSEQPARHTTGSTVETDDAEAAARSRSMESSARNSDNSGSHGDDQWGDDGEESATVPISGDLDADELRGLSKKQRRMLRKQRRDQQRSERQARSA